MDERLSNLISELSDDDAKFFRAIFKNFSTQNIKDLSGYELEDQFQKIQDRIKNIEDNALKKLEEKRLNPSCNFCHVRKGDTKRILEVSLNFYACNVCISDFYNKLQESEKV